MDSLYTAQQNTGSGDPAAMVSLGLMLAGLVVIVAATLVAHWTGRENFITRALERWSK